MEKVAVIRGGLGSQIILLAMEIALGRNIEIVVYSLTGYNSFHLKVVKKEDIGKEYLQYALDCSIPLEYKRFPADKAQMNSRKFAAIFANKEHVDNIIKPKKYKPFDGNVMHIREWDSKVLSEKENSFWIDAYDCKYGITDNLDYASQFNVEIVGSPTDGGLEDWLMLANSAVTCVGPPSMFTLSAAYFNPNLQLKIVKPTDASDRVFGGEYRVKTLNKTAEYFIKNLENVTYA